MPEPARSVWLANIPSGQKPLTSASPLGTLQAMRRLQDGASGRATRATRVDLLLETLALRHQLGVLARSHRRFRSTDRLLWLVLRWLWPRWREALVLVQPATVERWYRDGVRRCWRRRAGRPGRPSIDSSCRDLIRRMAAENCLWGAPRIHGELLKLGIAISERTVSRYLRGRPPTRSQTWRTFFANHLGGPTVTSPVTFADARDDDVVVDSPDVSSRPTPFVDQRVLRLHAQGHRRSRSFHPTYVSGNGSPARSHSGPYGRSQKHGPGPAAASMAATATTSSHGFLLCIPAVLRHDGTAKAMVPREFTIGIRGLLRALSSRQRRRRRTIRSPASVGWFVT